MRASSKSERTFWRTAACAIAAKLWLTSFIAINVRQALYDNGNFLEHAKFVLAGKWFGPYDDLTLIKGPGTELYLAFIRELGVPLPLAHQCFYAIASLTVCVALRPIFRSGALRAFVFVVVFFDPFTFSYNAWFLNRSQLMDSLALLFAAGAGGAILRAAGPVRSVASWLALFGAAFSALCLTREDTVWTFPTVALALGMYVWRARTTAPEDRLPRYALAAVPPLLLALSIAAISAINGAVYGWATTVENTSPDFVSAYQSMTRIVVPGVRAVGTFPAPRAARELAARVSPAAAELLPNFDTNGMWERTSCAVANLCGDVSAGWFQWAFRGAVAGAGHYTSGGAARAYYRRLSAELDAACAAGRLTCRAKSLSLSPPIYASDVPAMLRDAGETLSHAATFDQLELGSAEGMSAADYSVAADYANVAGSAGNRTSVFRGWLVRKPGATMHLAGRFVRDFLSIDFEPSPDIEKRLARDRAYTGDDLHRARFVLATSCERDCVLLVTNGRSGVVRIPLDPAVIDARAAGLAYHLDFSSVEPVAYATAGLRAAALNGVMMLYQIAGPIVLGVAATLMSFRVVRVLRARGKRRTPQYVPIAAVIATTIAGQCGVLGVVTAVSYYVLFPEYEAPIFPIVLLFSSVVTAREGEVLARALRARRRARQRKSVPQSVIPRFEARG